MKYDVVGYCNTAILQKKFFCKIIIKPQTLLNITYFEELIFIFWGLRSKAAALRFGARRFARPCGACSALVWPFGPPRRIARPNVKFLGFNQLTNSNKAISARSFHCHHQTQKRFAGHVDHQMVLALLANEQSPWLASNLSRGGFLVLLL